MKTKRASTALRPPKLLRQLRFSDFELHEELGTGTVGTIYRAVHLETGDVVAIKVLLPTISAESIVAQRFEREMVILEKLEHANIIRYLGGGLASRQLFYAMEYVDYGTLKDVLDSSGPLTWPEICSCGRQIASALQAAHNHGIIHRDLKPSNLFLNRDGQIKLGDFGVAKDTHEADITSTGLTVGTHAYMAPEQIHGEHEITGKVDLYAMGCLLFELATGHPPYQGVNFSQIFEQHLRGAIPRLSEHLPSVPPAIDDIVWQLIQKKPEDRPFNARAVQGVLMDVMGDAPGPAEPADVSADDAGDIGLQRMRQRLAMLNNLTERGNVSWWLIGGLLAAAIIGGVIASMLF